jgi:hypothetical protein
MCIDMFTFIISKSACVRDSSTAGDDNRARSNVCLDWRCKTWRVGCALRESQTPSQASSLIMKLCVRSKSTRPLLSSRALAIARTLRLLVSRLLERCGLKPLRRLFSAQPIPHENSIVHVTIIKLGRSLIASKNLGQIACTSTRKFPADQCNIETMVAVLVCVKYKTRANLSRELLQKYYVDQKSFSSGSSSGFYSIADKDDDSRRLN